MLQGLSLIIGTRPPPEFDNTTKGPALPPGIRMTPYVWYLPRRRRICGVDKKPGTGLHDDIQPGIMGTMGKERRNLQGRNHLLCPQIPTDCRSALAAERDQAKHGTRVTDSDNNP
jgi:hypothetical protein